MESDGKKYIIWGTGEVGKWFYREYKDIINITCFCDNFPSQSILYGKPVFRYHEYVRSEYEGELIVIAVEEHTDEIEKQLSSYGLKIMEDYLLYNMFDSSGRIYCEYVYSQMRSLLKNREFRRLEKSSTGKKKCYLITEEFPYGAGEDSFILPELQFLLAEFDVTIITSSAEPMRSRARHVDLMKGITCVIRIPYKREKLTSVEVKSYLENPILLRELQYIMQETDRVPERIGDALLQFSYAEKFYQKICEHKEVDLNSSCIVYTYWCTFRTLSFALHSNEYPEMKIVTRFHGYDLYNSRALYHRQTFRSFITERVHALLFASRKGFDYYASTFTDEDISKMWYAPLGVNRHTLKKIANKPKRFHLVSCSNVIQLKRIDLVVQALSLCSKEMCVIWTHFGAGNKFSHIKELADKLLGNKKNITYHFMGEHSNEDVIAFYEAEDISCFITTTSSEGGAPVSIQEALSFGLPIIGTDAGGIRDMIHRNGILLSTNPSVQEIADAICSIYSLTEAEWQSYSAESYRIWNECFNGKKNAKRFMSILKSL